MSNGWYVEFLLRHSGEIKENIYDSYTADTYEPGYTLDLDNFDYNNLLLIEKTLKDLIKNDRTTKREILILKHILDGKNIIDIERELKFSRLTVTKLFSRLCDKVAFMLGDVFTDEGYIEYMQEKYGLTIEQIEKLKSFMQSNKRHTLSFNRRK